MSRSIAERDLLLPKSHHPRRGGRLTEMPMPHRTCEIRRIHRYALACIRTPLRACKQANHTRQQLQIRTLQPQSCRMRFFSIALTIPV